MKQLILTISLSLSISVVLAQDNDMSRLSIKLGYSIVQHLESDIYGQSITTLNPGGVYESDVTGIRSMNGLDLKAYYFFKNNIGFYVNLGFGMSNNFIDYSNPDASYHSYESSADFHSESIGIAARFTSDQLPVTFLTGIHAGHFGYSYSYSVMHNDNGLWYDGSHSTLKAGLESSLEIRIAKGFHLFSELSYSIQPWVGGDGFDISYENDNGDYYSITSESPSMAALRFSLGFGYNF